MFSFHVLLKILQPLSLTERDVFIHPLVEKLLQTNNRTQSIAW